MFVGALVTFGSAGAINNLVSGIVLTYTSAFRLVSLWAIAARTGLPTYSAWRDAGKLPGKPSMIRAAT